MLGARSPTRRRVTAGLRRVPRLLPTSGQSVSGGAGHAVLGSGDLVTPASGLGYRTGISATLARIRRELDRALCDSAKLCFASATWQATATSADNVRLFYGSSELAHHAGRPAASSH